MFNKIAKPVARYVVALGVAAVSFGAASAQADAIPYAQPVKSVVAYADLDLSKDADAQLLYARLQMASERVCGSPPGRDLRMKRLYEDCYQDALSRAVDDIGHASVKAILAADERIRIASRSTKTQVRS